MKRNVKILMVALMLVAFPLAAKESAKCLKAKDGLTQPDPSQKTSRCKFRTNPPQSSPEQVLDPAYVIETNIRKLRQFQLNLKAKKIQLNLNQSLLK